MKKSSVFFLFLSLICLIVTSPPVNAQEMVLFEEDFEGEAGVYWDLNEGWAITPVGGNKLLQGEGHTWAFLNYSLPEEFRLVLRMKVLRGHVHLVTHLTKQSRYFIGLGEGRATLNKQYFPDDFRTDLASSARTLADSAWHEIEIISAGDSLRLIIDGQEQWAYSDPMKLDTGAIAFETLQGSTAQIDDILIYGGAEAASGTQGQEEDAQEEDGAPSSLSWVRTGGPLGGLGYDVRMDPRNPDRMYVTDAFAGVFISEDGGNLWYPSNQGITDRIGFSQNAIPVFCLTIDPNNPDIIWVGTEFQGGLFKSVDGGKTWTRKTNGITIQDGLTFRGISIEPGNSQVVYAGGEISSWAWAGKPKVGQEFDLTKGILYKSQDGGESWREIWRGDNLARYILINPQDTDILYLSTGIFDREAANSDPGAEEPGGVGVLKSTDGGQTWTQVNNGLKNLYVGSLYMHPEDPDILLAGTGNNQYRQFGGVYLTTDGAQTWEYVHNAGDANINSVEFSETDPAIAYAGGDPMILRSEDGGRTWVKVTPDERGWGSPGVRGGFPIDFQVDPRNPARIFANNYGGGNFLSEDGGVTWRVASAGYTGAQMRSIAVDPNHPGRVYTAGRSGIFVSHDGGGNWRGLAYPPYRVLEWNAVAVDPGNPEHLLAGNNWTSNILSSQNAGKTWQEVSPVPGDNQGIRVFAFAPSDPRRVYAGTAAYYSAGVFSPEMPASGIYKSEDGGQSWEKSTTGAFSDAHVIDISIAREDHEIIFAATSTYGVLRSLDSGENWTAVNKGVNLRQGANAVAIHPEHEGVVFAGIPFGGVYRSEDGGETWMHRSVGLNPEAYISDLIFDPTNPEILYVSDMLSGVYRSNDGGDTWRPFSENLRMKSVERLAISRDGAHLYAATSGEGVYRLDLNGQPPEEAPVPEREEGEQGEEDEEVKVEEEESEEDQDSEEDEPPVEPTPPPTSKEGDPEADRQICPGSYLPLLIVLVIWRGWKAEKMRGPRCG